MSRLRKIVNNTLISLVGQTVTWTSTLSLTIAYGRFLGDTRFGELYFAITFVGLIGFPVEFGFNQQLTREIAQEPQMALRYLFNTLAIKMLLWLLLYCCILLASWLLGYNTDERTLVIICGFTLLSTSIYNTFAAMHYAFERTVFPAVGTVLEKGLGALIGITLLKYGASVEVMALVLLGGSLVNATWQAFWFFQLEGILISIDLSLIRELIQTSIPFLIYGVLGVIYYRLDTILLSVMTNATVVGWYGAAYRLFDTMSFLPNLVIVAIMYPVFSKLSSTNELSLKLAIEKSTNFLLFFSIPIATGFIAAAPNIVGFLYHRTEFTPTIPALQLLAPGIVFLYINTILTTILISTRQEKKITLMAALALVFNLGLNLILIPHFQQIGAAAVTSLTELLLLCTAITLLPRHLLPLRSLLVGVKAVIASLAMALVILLLRQFNILMILPIAVLVYFGGATLLRTIPRRDLEALYGAIRFKVRRTSSVSALHEEEELEEDLTHFADMETIPLKIIYGITQPRISALHAGASNNPKRAQSDLMSFVDEEIVPLKELHGATQSQLQMHHIETTCDLEKPEPNLTNGSSPSFEDNDTIKREAIHNARPLQAHQNTPIAFD